MAKLSNDLRKLSSILNYEFHNTELLEEALTHPSISREMGDTHAIFNYERFEFLGDSVLGLVIAELLIIMFPDEPEGGLAKRPRGSCTRQNHRADCQ